MIRRFFVFLVLIFIAFIFLDLVLNYSERRELSPLAQRYAEEGPRELGAANLVTAVIVTYRGLDTLGEVTVLFISAAGVGLLLRRTREEEEQAEPGEEAEEEKKASSELVETATEVLLSTAI
jgi:multicomponent Na+:H+ antiporter subunit B